ncbi:MAG: DUF493 family protein [Phycisphaerales bacterium]
MTPTPDDSHPDPDASSLPVDPPPSDSSRSETPRAPGSPTDPSRPTGPTALEGTPEIEYPAPWHYQVLGRSPEAIAEAIAAAVGDVVHQMRTGRTSSAGNWHSMGLTLVVRDEAHRLEIYERLREHEAVRLVL